MGAVAGCWAVGEVAAAAVEGDGDESTAAADLKTILAV